MKRRAFVAMLGGAVAAPAVWPRAARAQQAMPVIGFLGTESPERWAARMRAFHQGLGETGYVEGRNVAIEYRWAEGQNDRLPSLVADLVRRQVTVLAATGGTLSAQAAKAATTTIPIVFYMATNPVTTGFVASLSRPGGNLTGLTAMGVELGAKRLELLHQVAPAPGGIGLLVNPSNPILVETLLSGVQAAASTLGVQLHVLHARTERDFDSVFATLAQLRAGGLVVAPEVFFNTRSQLLATLALRHALPAIHTVREFADAGGLMSYGGSFTEPFRQVGIYTGRILKGEKPADLPVQQATKVELIINLKTAKALGITVPLSLLGRADEVIE